MSPALAGEFSNTEPAGRPGTTGQNVNLRTDLISSIKMNSNGSQTCVKTKL